MYTRRVKEAPPLLYSSRGLLTRTVARRRRREPAGKVVQRPRAGTFKPVQMLGEKAGLVGSGSQLAAPMPVGANCVNAPPRTRPS